MVLSASKQPFLMTPTLSVFIRSNEQQQVVPIPRRGDLQQHGCRKLQQTPDGHIL
jgi:hypothetical protein